MLVPSPPVVETGDEVSAFGSEEEFFGWFKERYGHYPRDYYDDRGLPYPGDNPEAAAPSDSRRARIEALVTGGATAGERSAAAAAISRFDATHSETDRMQRGGNYIEEL